MRVSWQLTGVRRDAYARKHPMVVEEPKKPEERGKFLNPVEHGYPEELAIHRTAKHGKGMPAAI